MTYVSLILITLMLVGCATPLTHPYATNADYMAATGIDPTRDPHYQEYTRPRTEEPRMNAAEIAHANRLIEQQRNAAVAASDGVSGWDVLGAIVAIPLLIPIAMISSYPSYRYGRVHCRSYVYKDQYHSTCY